jgi:hypothetical protein
MSAGDESKDPVTAQIEAMDGTSASAKSLGLIAERLVAKGAPRQITELMGNESRPYDTIETLKLLKLAFFYQSGRYARAASETTDEKDHSGLARDFLLQKAHHSIAAGIVVDRAANIRGRVMMTEDERQSLMDMTDLLESRLVSMTRRAQPDFAPEPEDFHHIGTAINTILEPVNVHITDVT